MIEYTGIWYTELTSFGVIGLIYVTPLLSCEEYLNKSIDTLFF